MSLYLSEEEVKYSITVPKLLLFFLRMVREEIQIWQNFFNLTSQMFSVLYLHWFQCLKKVCDGAVG